MTEATLQQRLENAVAWHEAERARHRKNGLMSQVRRHEGIIADLERQIAIVDTDQPGADCHLPPEIQA